MIAIIAAFNLNTAQFNITNAFLYTGLLNPKATFCKIPPRFKDSKESLI